MSTDELVGWHTDPINDTPAFAPKAPHADCASCPLALQPFVPSYAPPVGTTIPLIIIGEAPGATEARLGQPFVGESGKLLDAVLEHINIDPSSCYKTNAVLCRPPQNDLGRYPQAVVCCQERLRAELAAIACNTMVAMGNTAVQALDALTGHINKDGILKRRSNWYIYDNSPHTQELRHYLATLHPAFVLRSTGYISQLLADMRSIGLKPDRDWLHTPYTTLDRSNWGTFLSWLHDITRDQLAFSYDVETANLDYHSELLELGLAISVDHAWVVPGAAIRNSPQLRSTLSFLFERGKPIPHNGKFDNQVLNYNGIFFFDIYSDTMLEHYCLEENKGTHGLKQIGGTYLGVPDWESEYIDSHFRNQDRKERDYSTIPVEMRRQYLAIDCCVTLALHQLFTSLIEADGVMGFHRIAIDASNALQRTEYEGIKVDVPYLRQVLKALEKAIKNADSLVKLQATEYAIAHIELLERNDNWSAWHNPDPTWIKGTQKLPTPQQQYEAVLDKIVDGVSLGSWQQMQVLLYDILHLKHTKKLGWKTNPRSTNAEALDSLQHHPFVTVLQEYRRLDKIKGTYVEKLLVLADSNDRVHVSYNIHGTETSRWSANDGLHGIPRPSDQWGRALRGSFIAKPNHKLVMCDYSGGELRVFAALSQEPFLLNLFANDEDPHGIITLRVFGNDPRFAGMTTDSWDKTKQEWQLPQVQGYTAQQQKDYWKENRTTGKNVVFGGLVYLGEAPGIVAMIRAQTGKIIEIPIVAKVLDAVRKEMPIGIAWQMQQFRFARDNHYVQNRFGFKRRFPIITPENLDDIKKASVNAPVQGSLATLTALSGIDLTRQGVHVLMYNHDQIICEASDHEAQATADLVQATMIDMGNRWFSEVKWRADVEISNQWYEKRPTFESE